MSDDLSRQVARRVLSLKKKSETWVAFGERVGLTPQKLSNWRGGGGASLDAVSTVLDLHRPRLAPAWLLAGVRPQYLPEGMSKEDALRAEADQFAVRLEVIGMVHDGTVDAYAVKRLAATPSAADDADAVDGGDDPEGSEGRGDGSDPAA